MICEKILGRAADDDPNVDWVEIDWKQTVRRALRLVSRGGRKVDILLPRNQSLRHGDVVATVETTSFAISVKPCAVLVTSPATLEQMGVLAAELGNQHAPLEIEAGRLITLDDGPARQLADDLGVPYERTHRRFHPRRNSVIAPTGPRSV